MWKLQPLFQTLSKCILNSGGFWKYLTHHTYTSEINVSWNKTHSLLVGWHCEMSYLFFPSSLHCFFFFFLKGWDLQYGKYFAKVTATLEAWLWTLITLNWTLVNYVYTQLKPGVTFNTVKHVRSLERGKKFKS